MFRPHRARHGRRGGSLHAEPGHPLERLAIAAFVLVTLSGPSVVGLWGAIAGVSGARGDAGGMVAAAVCVTTVASIAHGLRWNRDGERWIPTVAAGVAAVPLGIALTWGLPATAAVTAALVVVGALCGSLLPWLVRHLPEALDGLAPRRKGFASIVVLVCAGVFVRTATLSVFMGDSSHPELSMAPEAPFAVEHSCLSAYVEGARLATEGVDNLYAPEHWPDLVDPTRSGPPPAYYAPFKLDAFAYPPPFLLWPRALLSPLRDFPSQRAVWFAVNGLFVAAGLWIVPAWLGGRAGLRALLFVPLLWMSQLFTLQVGNVHAVVIVAVMLALVAFDTRRPALGGALLAFAVVAKLSPAVLVVVLVVQRRFREVAWTAVFGLAWLLAGAALFGTAPLVAFVSYELPRLSSGEALVFLTGKETVLINLSPFGMPFKLSMLGLDPGDSWAIGRRINRGFTVVLLVLTVVAAFKGAGRRARAEVWAALLTLAPLQSPLAPPYVVFPALWLLSMGSSDVRGTTGLVAVSVLWIALSTVPAGGGPLWVAFSLFQAGLVVATAATLLLRRSPVDDSSDLHD